MNRMGILERDKKVQGKVVPVSEMKTFCFRFSSVMKQVKYIKSRWYEEEEIFVRLGQTDILSCIMHGLVLREKEGSKAAFYSREDSGTRGCTEIIS